MKTITIFSLALLTFAFVSPSPSALADHGDGARVLYRCGLKQKVPGYNEEELVGYIAPTDMRDPIPRVPFVYPNIHFSRGHGVQGIVYGFHDRGKPGSRLLLQIFDGKEEKATAYESDAALMSVGYLRENDQAVFELACRRL